MKKKKKNYDTKDKITVYIFIILTFALAIFSFYYMYTESKWFGKPTTTAVFVECGKAEIQESGPETYKSKYRYYINDEPYEAELSVSKEDCKSKRGKEIYYNPDKPSEYNIGNTLFTFIMSLIMGILFTVTSISLLVVSLLPNKKKEA